MKLYTYLVILAGLTVLLTFAGVPTGAGKILTDTGLLSSPQDFTSSSFFQTINAVLLAVGLVSIVVGFITRQSSESILISGFTVLLFSFVADYLSILVYVNSTYSHNWISYFISLIFIPLIIGYGISVAEWWKGSSD